MDLGFLAEGFYLLRGCLWLQQGVIDDVGDLSAVGWGLWQAIGWCQWPDIRQQQLAYFIDYPANGSGI
jgi:hypothetical protein